MLFSLPYRYEEERLKARRERSVQSGRARAGWGLAPGWARVRVCGWRQVASTQRGPVACPRGAQGPAPLSGWLGVGPGFESRFPHLVTE